MFLTRFLVRFLPTTWNPSTMALVDLRLRANAVRIRVVTPRVVLDAVDDDGWGRNGGELREGREYSTGGSTDVCIPAQHVLMMCL